MKIKSDISNRGVQTERHTCKPQSEENSSTAKSEVPKTDLTVNLSGFHVGILVEAAIEHGCSVESALEMFLDGDALLDWQRADFPLP